MLDMPFYEDTFVRINIVEGELNEREREGEISLSLSLSLSLSFLCW